MSSLDMNETRRREALRRFAILDTPSDPAIDEITHLAARLLKTRIALVSLIDDNRQWFKSRVGLDATQTPRDVSFCDHAVRDDRLFIVEDAQEDARFQKNPLVTGDPNIRFYAGAPLRTSDGVALGTLCVIDDKPRSGMSDEERQILIHLSAMVMAHIESQRAAGLIEPVTGLGNRLGFIRDIDAFIADETSEGVRIGVLVIKVISPLQYAELVRTLGHAAADLFEVTAVDHVRKALPDHTRLYHLSGGRFGCVLPLNGVKAVRDRMNHIAAAVGEPILYKDVPLTTARALGVAEYPIDGRMGEHLLRASTSAAQQSLEEAKPWSGYSREWDQGRKRSFKLLRDLTAALAAHDQLSVVYQPQIDLSTGACIGCEALMRWNHPEFGPVSPAEFIGLAEKAALMPALTDWMLNKALFQAARWWAEGQRLQIAINISVVDLEQTDFAERLVQMMARYKVLPEWISIELTETAMITNRTKVAQQLYKIREQHIEIAIDDFGTGQSAMSYLKHIPAKYVKIDQMFVQRLDKDKSDQLMVKSMLDLAHALGHQVIAEGIESAAAYEWLRENGCDFGQGYYMSRPLSASEFTAWLCSGRRYHAQTA